MSSEKQWWLINIVALSLRFLKKGYSFLKLIGP